MYFKLDWLLHYILWSMYIYIYLSLLKQGPLNNFGHVCRYEADALCVNLMTEVLNFSPKKEMFYLHSIWFQLLCVPEKLNQVI